MIGLLISIFCLLIPFPREHTPADASFQQPVELTDSLSRQTLIDQASYYLDLHEYTKSMEICNQLISDPGIQQDHKSMTRLLLMMYNNSYFTQSDSSHTQYLDQAYALARGSNDSVLISETCIDMGKAYYRNGELPKAIASYQEGRDYISEKGGYQELYAAIYQHLCFTLLEDSAAAACRLSAYIYENVTKNDIPDLLSNALLGRAYCFARLGQVDSTLAYLERSEMNRLKTSKAEASPGYYSQMYRVSLIIKDYDHALEYLEKSVKQTVNINRANSTIALANSRAEFDYELQKAKIKELKYQNEIEKERTTRRNIVIATISFILLLIILLAIYTARQNKKLRLSYDSLVKRYVEIDHLNDKIKDCPNHTEPKRSGSFIKDEEEIFSQLKILFDQGKIYKDKDLNLISLADQLHTNTTYLSNIINNRFGMNFKSLINTRRINEARKLLVTDEYSNFSIEGIANEVGFQSRSSFYQTFKQTTGLTPTDYIDSFRNIQLEEQVPEFETVE